MKKVFIVFQYQFSEGNFGDCELSNSKIIGVFASREKAIEVAENMPISVFTAQFGEGDEDYYIKEEIIID